MTEDVPVDVSAPTTDDAPRHPACPVTIEAPTTAPPAADADPSPPETALDPPPAVQPTFRPPWAGRDLPAPAPPTDAGVVENGRAVDAEPSAAEAGVAAGPSSVEPAAVETPVAVMVPEDAMASEDPTAPDPSLDGRPAGGKEIRDPGEASSTVTVNPATADEPWDPTVAALALALATEPPIPVELRPDLPLQATEPADDRAPDAGNGPPPVATEAASPAATEPASPAATDTELPADVESASPAANEPELPAANEPELPAAAEHGTGSVEGPPPPADPEVLVDGMAPIGAEDAPATAAVPNVDSDQWPSSETTEAQPPAPHDRAPYVPAPSGAPDAGDEALAALWVLAGEGEGEGDRRTMGRSHPRPPRRLVGPLLRRWSAMRRGERLNVVLYALTGVSIVAMSLELLAGPDSLPTDVTTTPVESASQTVPTVKPTTTVTFTLPPVTEEPPAEPEPAPAPVVSRAPSRAPVPEEPAPEDPAPEEPVPATMPATTVPPATTAPPRTTPTTFGNTTFPTPVPPITPFPGFPGPTPTVP